MREIVAHGSRRVRQGDHAPSPRPTPNRYTYDSFANITTMQLTERQGVTYSTAYQYDNGDHMMQMTLPSSRVIDYSRDGVRRINGITTTKGNEDDPDKPNYYCASQHRYVDIPADFPDYNTARQAYATN